MKASSEFDRGRLSIIPRWFHVVVMLAVVVSLVATESSPAQGHDVSQPDRPTTGPPELPTDDAPYETEFDLNDAEVTWYASRHGISVERSLEIANWMTEVGPAIEDLAQTMPEVYAEVRVVHGGERGDRSMEPGDVRVDLRVTDRTHQKVEELIAELDSLHEAAGRISTDVIEVPKTLAELEAEVAEFRLQDKTTRIEFDFDSGTLVEDTRNRPDPVPSNHDCPSVDSKKWDSARLMLFDKDGGGCSYSGGCTAGLGAFLSGRYGLTTAGHCFDDDNAGFGQGLISNGLDHVVDVMYISSLRTSMHLVGRTTPIFHRTTMRALPPEDSTTPRLPLESGNTTLVSGGAPRTTSGRREPSG